MAYRNGPKIVTDGLVLCLDAAGTKSYPRSGSIWYNVASSGFNCNIYGASFSSGYGGNFVFNPSNSNYIQTSALGSTPSGFSVSSWFYVANGTNGGNMFSSNNSDSTKLYAIRVGTDGKLYFQTWLATQYISSAGLISMDTWYFVTTTQTGVANEGDSATINIYVNSQKITTTSLASPTGLGNYTRIGRITSAYHDGGIASVMCHKKVLSQEEVEQNYNSTKGRFGL